MKVLKDRYEIINKIGTGGMADVYLAEDKELNRRVAIKILHNRYADDTVFIERFKREARSAANLAHQNIVSIYDWGKDDEGYFLVMEVLKGKSLKELIGDRGHLSESEAIDIAIQVCSALSYAHENRIVHRDIKPHNIIIDDSGHVKVTDFGIARISDDGATVTQTGAMLGTPQYFSPEQAQGYITGAPSDIYSLGITLFEMLTGELPFTGDNPITIAFKQVHEDPPMPSEFRADISPQVEQIILKTLNKDPENRYATADELSYELKLLRNGDSFGQTIVMSSPIKKPVKKTQGAGRKALPWIAVIVILLLAIAGLGYSLYQSTQPKNVNIPDVKGKNSEVAIQILEAAGFTTDIQNEKSDTVPEGDIISQDPAGRSTAAAGSTISLKVSSGEQLVKVPDVRGYNQATATRMLQEEGLEVGDISHDNSPSYGKDQVMRTEPVPDRKVARGTKINLVLNKGIETVRVPYLVNLSREEAIKILTKLRLLPVEESKHSSETEKGVVLEQSPEANVEISEGSKVRFTTSKGPEQITLDNYIKKPSELAINSLTGLGLKYNIDYIQVPKQQNGIVFAQDPAPGTTLNIGDTVTLKVVKNKPKKELPTSSNNQ